jgi:5-dehydro-2-deoxygluconokinase
MVLGSHDQGEKRLMPSLDLITIGRSSVDLYGVQVGGRLEDMASFNKYIGGSPTNMAAGTARLGLKSALITRVGDEHMGRFIVEQLQREGVDTRGVVTDTERLTALVLLGIRDEARFPLIFYRENCADMALCEDDVDPDFIAEAGCVTVTGTHLSHSQTEAAVLKALNLARDNGARTALDIDYRPNLWGLAGHGEGEERFIESRAVTAKLQSTLALFDLIVGTEEEFHIAGGSTNTLEALRSVRKLTKAMLVCKRGPMGASAFGGEIPASLDDGITGPGFPIEVFNVLGAGDGFMSGLLRGWLSNEPWETALTWANACGAFAVSRHGCAPAYPSWDELQWFLDHGSSHRALRKDVLLEHVHWASNRHDVKQPLEIVDLRHADRDDFSSIRKFGFIADWDRHRTLMYQAIDWKVWIGRPAMPGTMEFNEWPLAHRLVCTVGKTPAEVLLKTCQAARRHGLEVMLELDATNGERLPDLLDAGVWPDYWVLPAKGLAARCDVLAIKDPWCRGVYSVGGAGEEHVLVLGTLWAPATGNEH